MRNLTLSEEKEAANGSAAATPKRAAAGRRTAVDAAAAATRCLDKRARRREATIPAPAGSKFRVEERGAIERGSADEVSGRNSEGSFKRAVRGKEWRIFATITVTPMVLAQARPRLQGCLRLLAMGGFRVRLVAQEGRSMALMKLADLARPYWSGVVRS
jgi:hypothetical protein